MKTKGSRWKTRSWLSQLCPQVTQLVAPHGRLSSKSRPSCMDLSSMTSRFRSHHLSSQITSKMSTSSSQMPFHHNSVLSIATISAISQAWPPRLVNIISLSATTGSKLRLNRPFSSSRPRSLSHVPARTKFCRCFFCSSRCSRPIRNWPRQPHAKDLSTKSNRTNL